MKNQVHNAAGHEGTKKMAPPKEAKTQNRFLKSNAKHTVGPPDLWLYEFFQELKSDDFMVIAWIKDFYKYTKVKKKEHDGLTYIWIDYEYLGRQLPMLNAQSKNSIYKLLLKLVKIGVLDSHLNNKGKGKSYYGFSHRLLELFENYDSSKKRENTRPSSSNQQSKTTSFSSNQQSSFNKGNSPVKKKDKLNNSILMKGYSKSDQIGVRGNDVQIRKKVYKLVKRDKNLMDKFLKKGELPSLVARFMRHWEEAECRYMGDRGLLKYLHSWIGYQVVEEPEPEHSPEIKEVIGILTKLWGEKKYRKSDIVKIQKFLDDEPDYGAKAIHVLADHVADHFEPSFRNVSFILGKLWDDSEDDVKYAIDGGW